MGCGKGGIRSGGAVLDFESENNSIKTCVA